MSIHPIARVFTHLELFSPIIFTVSRFFERCGNPDSSAHLVEWCPATETGFVGLYYVQRHAKYFNDVIRLIQKIFKILLLNKIVNYNLSLELDLAPYSIRSRTICRDLFSFVRDTLTENFIFLVVLHRRLIETGT